jgi:hypothetical protein
MVDNYEKAKGESSEWRTSGPAILDPIGVEWGIDPCAPMVAVARTSADWFHQLVLPNADLLCFPTGKTRFIKPDGSPGPAPTNGIALIAKGGVCCEALRRSGLGFCVIVDRTAAPSARMHAAHAAEHQLPSDLFTDADRIMS